MAAVEERCRLACSLVPHRCPFHPRLSLNFTSKLPPFIAQASCFAAAHLLRPDRTTERIQGVNRSAAALADYGVTRDRDEAGWGRYVMFLYVCMILCYLALLQGVVVIDWLRKFPTGGAFYLFSAPAS